MLYAIWYPLYNFKNVKNTRRGVLLLVKLQVLADGTKSRKAANLTLELNCLCDLILLKKDMSLHTLSGLTIVFSIQYLRDLFWAISLKYLRQIPIKTSSFHTDNTMI